MLKVAVVILHYKYFGKTLNCLRSVKKSKYKELEIIVVDNNPDDGLSPQMKKFSEVIYLPNKENLGYTGGNNTGIVYALAHGADYIFILNPDMELDPSCISELVKSMDDKKVGIVGPKILFADRKTIWYAGGVFDQANVLGSHRGVDEADQGQYNEGEETQYVTGGAMFVRARIFDEIGLFDDKYFLYYEDSDFCYRAKQAGFKLIYNPKAVAYHENAQSTGLGSPLQDYYITRNRMLFAAKFLPFRTRFALFREGLRHWGMPVRRKALLDFLFGKLGKGREINSKS